MAKFDCNIMYKKVEGDSYTSTYNKLLAHKFIDKYLNLKIDVASWRNDIRKELNNQASNKLGREVNLFGEKRLLNGIRLVPDMKLFGMIDQINKNTPIIQDTVTEETTSINKTIYNSINQKEGSFIKSDKIEQVQQIINEYNKLNTGKVLSLRQVGTNLANNLIFTEYKVNYLYSNTDQPIEEIEETEFEDTDSSSNFNLPCIKD